MRTSLKHLDPAKRQQIQAILHIIKKAVQPEKILLFGLYAAESGMADQENNSILVSCAASYDLLVISRRGDHRHDYEIQDMIENRCQFDIPVTVLVHDIDYVNEQLRKGHYFFSMLEREGILLYDGGAEPLAPPAPPDLSKIKAIAENDFTRWWHRAEVFFNSALFNIQAKEWKIAAFLLHQAAEQAYQSILLGFTGYKPCTHNLDKLRRYTKRFSIELAMVFPRNSSKEEHLFKLLLQSYLDARYREDYSISEDELNQLAERVSQLLSIATRICRNRFASLGRMAGVGATGPGTKTAY